MVTVETALEAALLETDEIKRLDPPLDPRTILIATQKGATPMPAAQRFVRIAKTECRKRLAKAVR